MCTAARVHTVFRSEQVPEMEEITIVVDKFVLCRTAWHLVAPLSPNFNVVSVVGGKFLGNMLAAGPPGVRKK